MALYDSRGRIQYLDLEEINNAVHDYTNFMARVGALDEDIRTGDREGVRVHAQCLFDDEIAAVKRLPREIRYRTAFRGTTDQDLKELEKRCKQILRSKK